MRSLIATGVLFAASCPALAGPISLTESQMTFGASPGGSATDVFTGPHGFVVPAGGWYTLDPAPATWGAPNNPTGNTTVASIAGLQIGYSASALPPQDVTDPPAQFQGQFQIQGAGGATATVGFNGQVTAGWMGGQAYANAQIADPASLITLGNTQYSVMISFGWPSRTGVTGIPPVATTTPAGGSGVAESAGEFYATITPTGSVSTSTSDPSTATTPEPGTMFLSGIGVGAMLLGRLRRARNGRS